VNGHVIQPPAGATRAGVPSGFRTDGTDTDLTVVAHDADGNTASAT
jgi:hypothetical protein